MKNSLRKDSLLLSRYLRLPEEYTPVTPSSLSNVNLDNLLSNKNNTFSDSVHELEDFSSLHINTVPNYQPRDKSKNKKKCIISSREKKQINLFQLQKSHQTYALYAPLNKIWKQYIRQLIGDNPNANMLETRLIKADFHGAIIKLVQSKSPHCVGAQGIVLKETKKTFVIITKQNLYKTLFKMNSVFTVLIEPEHLVTLYGNHIMYKTSERSSRKFKAKKTIEIL